MASCRVIVRHVGRNDKLFQEQDALGERFHVAHLGDGGALEQRGKRRETPIVEVYVEIHVLVNGQELFGDRLVQQGDTCCRVHK